VRSFCLVDRTILQNLIIARDERKDRTMARTKTKILLDSGDFQETQRIRKLLGFLDGQTTNPERPLKSCANQGNPSLENLRQIGISWA
jgi:hypothetical protein